MNSLPNNTKRRIKKIPQIPHVWEGDRLPLAGMMSNLEPELEAEGECIIWVDASEGFVRAMEVVRANTGPEAVVRTLLKAIEHPHNPAKPARPQKVVVRDRELQFFLRGALQNLDITVEYVPNLLLIDELWRNFAEMKEDSEDGISSELEESLQEVALEIWDQEPWQLLADHDVIKIELNRWDIDSIYACVMGMLGKEYGIILYRSLDSLKKFRCAALSADEDQLEAQLEAAFLQQDCWFVNFAPLDDEDLDYMEDEDYDLGDELSSDVQALFGSIHPYEGMRPLQDEEEFSPIYTALQALNNFVIDTQEYLVEENIPEITKTYQIEPPTEQESVTVKVSTLPSLTRELIAIFEEAEAEEEAKLAENTFFLKDDLIPNGSIIAFSMISWEMWDKLQNNDKMYIESLSEMDKESSRKKVEGLPTIIIQTTRPKAKVLIEKIKEEGGIKGIAFNPGNDPYEELDYELGIMQTPKNNLYIFAQLIKDDSNLYQGMRIWQKRAKKINNRCAVLIATGASGSSRHNPQLKDMIALFETNLVSNKDLGLGTLTLESEWDED
jgi:hypothetical protein